MEFDVSWSRVSRGARTYTIGSIVTMATSFLAVPLTVHLLGREHYGHLVLLLSAYSLGCLALDPGIGAWLVTSISRELGRANPARVRQLIRAFVRYELAACIFLALALSMAMPAVFPNVPPIEVALLYAYLVATAVSSVLEFTFYGFSNFTPQARLTALPGLLRLAGLGVLYLLEQPRLDAVWALYPLSVLVAAACSWRSWRRHTQVLPRAESGRFPDLWKEVWSGEPKYYILFTAVRRAHDNIPIWIIRSILGRGAVAAYDIAFGLFTGGLSIFKTIENAILPETTRLHEQRPAAALEVTLKAVRTGLLLAIVAVPVGWAVAAPFVRLLFGAEFSDAVWPLRALILALIPWAFLMGQRVPFYTLQATKYLPLSYALSTGFLALWLLVFTSKGLLWVAVGYSLDVVSLVLITGLLLRRLRRII